VGTLLAVLVSMSMMSGCNHSVKQVVHVTAAVDSLTVEDRRPKLDLEGDRPARAARDKTPVVQRPPRSPKQVQPVGPARGAVDKRASRKRHPKGNAKNWVPERIPMRPYLTTGW
jgi:hypothetical protein